MADTNTQVPVTDTSTPATTGGLVDNQLHTIFNNALGRDATPYEISQYKTKPIQTLANLKTDFSKLNTGSSIVDYLKSIGQDSSLTNRTALAAKYGISDIGSAEGNTALLKALKSGQQPTTQSVSGTVTPPVTSTTTDTTGTSTDTSTTTPTTQSTDPSQPNYVSPSLSTDPTNPLSDPTIATYKDQYVQAQTNVANIDKQITDLQNTINNSLASKKAHLAEMGVDIDEAQITSEIYVQNAPLLQQIAQLKSDRTQAVSEQSTAGKTYQDAQNDFYKSASLGINQQKLSDAEQKQSETIDLDLQKFGLTEQQDILKPLITSIQNGSSGLSPAQLTQLEQVYGLPSGYLSNMIMKPAPNKAPTPVAPTDSTTVSPVTIFGIPTPFSSTKTTTKTGTGDSSDPLNLNQ